MRRLTPARAGALVAVVALATGALALNHNLVGVFYDDGVYAGLAWAMGHGQGYVYPNLPGQPAGVHYPPLYPWTLTPLFALFSVPAAAFLGKVLNLIFAAAASGLITWHAARTELLGASASPWLSAAVVALAAIAIPWITLLTVLFSEPLFALLVVATVILADGVPLAPAREYPLALAGITAALAFLARSIGIALLVALLVRAYLVTRAQGPKAVARGLGFAGLPLLAAALGWGGWVALHRQLDPLLVPDYGSYGEILRSAGGAALGGFLPDLPRPLAVLTLGWTPNRVVYYIVGIAALGVGLYGLALVARRSTVGIALAAYLAILACWPVPPDRFLWAVLPWIALTWTAGAAALWRFTRLRGAVIVLAVLLGFGYARYEWRGFRGRWWALAGDRVSQAFSRILPTLDTLPPRAVIATDHDPLVWLYSRRQAVPLYIYALQGHETLEPPPAVHRAYLERQGVTHLLVAADGALGAGELERLRASYPDWLRLVRRWPDNAMLYEVTR